MRILIEAHHPAHIHFFKRIIAKLQEAGHVCRMVARDRDVMVDLLQACPWMKAIGLTKAAMGAANRFPLVELPRRHFEVARTICRFKPHLALSLMGSYSQFAMAFGIPNWIFTDSEFQKFNHAIAHPFATRLYTPRCFYKDLGAKHIRYPSYHELAFLHPDHFKPDEGVLRWLEQDEPGGYVLLRLSAWDTFHDAGKAGLGEAAAPLLRWLEREGRPFFVIPEGGKLPPEWESRRFPAPPHKLHDALAFARLVVTEGASTASEAVCLGAPVIYVNSTAPRGYLEDQRRRYGQPHRFRDGRGVLEAVQSELERPFDREEARRRRQAIGREHVDLSRYVVREVGKFAARRAA